MKAPTLADAAMRESLRPHGHVLKRIGEFIAQARKFVLDTDASRFLSDLAHASYMGSQRSSLKAIEQTRQLARSPHTTTWIEYDARAFRDRTMEAYSEVRHVVAKRVLPFSGLGKLYLTEDKAATGVDVVPTIGWLVIETPFEESCVSFTMFTFAGFPDGVLLLPFMFGWTTDDSIPFKEGAVDFQGISVSHVATGLKGYNVPQVVIGRTPGITCSPENEAKLLAEFIGELRFLWALLAAINDVPIGLKHVRPAKGFYARGRYRHYFEHSVISILLPKGRDPRVVARHIVALSRRRAHLVRGHWRRDWTHPGEVLCAHEFYADKNQAICLKCGMEKSWVKEHQRGDASLGMVVHDYAVKHETT